jgi:hypothetical protein
VARVVRMRLPSARFSLYTSELAEGRGQLAISLISLPEVGGGRSADEALPFTWRRLPMRYRLSSTGEPLGEASSHAVQRHSFRSDASKTHI